MVAGFSVKLDVTGDNVRLRLYHKTAKHREEGSELRLQEWINSIEYNLLYVIYLYN